MLASPSTETRVRNIHQKVSEARTQNDLRSSIIDSVSSSWDDLDRSFETSKAAGAISLSHIEEGAPWATNCGRKVKAIGGSFSKRIADDPRLANQHYQARQAARALPGKFGVAAQGRSRLSGMALCGIDRTSLPQRVIGSFAASRPDASRRVNEPSADEETTHKKWLNNLRPVTHFACGSGWQATRRLSSKPRSAKVDCGTAGHRRRSRGSRCRFGHAGRLRLQRIFKRPWQKLKQCAWNRSLQ